MFQSTSTNNSPFSFGGPSNNAPPQGGRGLTASQSTFGLNKQAQPQTQNQQPQQGGLFNTNSMTNTPTHQPSGGSMFGSNTNIGAGSIFGKSEAPQQQEQPSIFNQSTSSNSMSHSQSTMALNSAAGTGFNSPAPSGGRAVNTPNWKGSSRRLVPSHMTPHKKSSFNAPEKASITPSRHNSVSQQSPPSYGQSFGVPKPQHSKRTSMVDEEDAPPIGSYYDMNMSASSAAAPPPSLPPPTSMQPTPAGMGGLKRSGTSMTLANRRESAVPERAITPEDYSANAVIVFGFPHTMASAIIKHFSRFGEILENVNGGGGSPSKRMAAMPVQSGDNWIKITYESNGGAQRALGENGSVFAGKFVIGVKLNTQSNSRELRTASERSMNGAAAAATPYDDEMMDVDSPPRRALPSTDMYPQVEESAESQHQHPEKTMSRATSMPVLNEGRRLRVQNNRSIYNNKRPRYAPSMANVKEQPEGSKPKGKQSWLSWTTKRAQELVFGWDDL